MQKYFAFLLLFCIGKCKMKENANSWQEAASEMKSEISQLRLLFSQSMEENAKLRQENLELHQQGNHFQNNRQTVVDQLLPEIQQITKRLHRSLKQDERLIRINAPPNSSYRQLQSQLNSARTDIDEIRLLETNTPSLRSQVTIQQGELHRLTNLTNLLTYEIGRLRGRKIDNRSRSIFGSPLERDVRKLHFELSRIRQRQLELEEGQKWSQFLNERVETKLGEMQQLMNEELESIREQLLKHQSYIRPVPLSPTVRPPIMPDDNLLEGSGSGEEPPPQPEQIQPIPWPQDLFNQIKLVTEEQQKARKYHDKAKEAFEQLHKLQAQNSILISKQNVLSKRLETVERTKVDEKQFQRLLFDTKEVADQLVEVGALANALQMQLTSKTSHYDRELDLLSQETKMSAFEAGRAISVAEVIKKVQSNHFTSIQNFSQDLNEVKAQMVKFALKVTTLQADYLNSTLFLYKTSEKDHQQDLHLARHQIKLDDYKNEHGLMSTQLKSLEATVNGKIGYALWKEQQEQLNQIKKKLGVQIWRADILNLTVSRAENSIHLMETTFPSDCSMNISSKAAHYGSGIYLISPIGWHQSIRVQCDMLDSGGKWILIQRRFNGDVNFNKTWFEYAKGFGSVEDEFYLGNRLISAITNANTYSLRIDTWDIYGDYRFVDYATFKIGSEADKFPLRLGNMTGGNLTDSFTYHRNMKFSAADAKSDFDASSTHCAKYYAAGWWYSHCHKANLNGNFYMGMLWFDNSTSDWIQLRKTAMKIRPVTAH